MSSVLYVNQLIQSSGQPYHPILQKKKLKHRKMKKFTWQGSGRAEIGTPPASCTVLTAGAPTSSPLTTGHPNILPFPNYYLYSVCQVLVSSRGEG